MRLAVPLAIDPAALEGWRPDLSRVDFGGDTMGTTWSVRVAVPTGFDLSPLKAAISDCLENILDQMSHWRAHSLLGRFNRAPAGSWYVLPPEFASVMEAAFVVADRSGSAFDPAIGELVNLWGFGPPEVHGTPSAEEISAALARSGWCGLDYHPPTRRLRQPGGVHLDLSGIAKGYAVDAVMGVMRDHGCRHCLVEIGGELAGAGIRPDGDPWWVDLETPAQGFVPVRVALHQLAVATSGDYVRGRHTINPRTGYPVAHAAVISVIHDCAMLADAWATALSVLSPPEMQRLAAAQSLMVRALLREGAGLSEWISPALEEMIGEGPETGNATA
jgi:Membrane-associated lipoprotein involved in thiamine biosynthesis